MSSLEANLGYKFNNQALLKLALTHKSMGGHNNEKLEFLGDSILNYVAADFLFKNFPTLAEGDLSRIRSGLVREETLIKIANRLGVSSHLHFNPSFKMAEATPSNLADAVEAIFAAVYLEAGIETAKLVITNHLEIVIKNNEAILKKDPKTQLQERLQGRGLPLPTYMVIKSTPAPNREYEVCCIVEKYKIKVCSTGPTRKHAEASAAQLALNQIPHM